MPDDEWNILHASSFRTSFPPLIQRHWMRRLEILLIAFALLFLYVPTNWNEATTEHVPIEEPRLLQFRQIHMSSFDSLSQLFLKCSFNSIDSCAVNLLCVLLKEFWWFFSISSVWFRWDISSPLNIPTLWIVQTKSAIVFQIKCKHMYHTIITCD